MMHISRFIPIGSDTGELGGEKIDIIAEENFYKPFLTMDMGMLLMALVSIAFITIMLEIILSRKYKR